MTISKSESKRLVAQGGMSRLEALAWELSHDYEISAMTVLAILRRGLRRAEELDIALPAGTREWNNSYRAGVAAKVIAIREEIK